MNTEMEDYRHINDAVVQSLVCIYDDADFNVEMELGVLVEIAEPESVIEFQKEVSEIWFL